jgi:hypothetical protein
MLLDRMKIDKVLYTLPALLLIFGSKLPLITVSKLVVVENQYSLIEGVFSLLSDR